MLFVYIHQSNIQHELRRRRCRRGGGERTEEELRGTVVQCDDKACVRLQGAAELASHAKVADFELATVIVQNIGRLEVTVQHPVVMQVVHPIQELIHEALDLHACADMLRSFCAVTSWLAVIQQKLPPSVLSLRSLKHDQFPWRTMLQTLSITQ